MGWMRNSTVAVVLAILAIAIIGYVVKTQFLKGEEKIPLQVKSKATPSYAPIIMVAPSEIPAKEASKEAFADEKAKDLFPAIQYEVTYPNGKKETVVLFDEEKDKLMTDQKIGLDKIVPIPAKAPETK